MAQQGFSKFVAPIISNGRVTIPKRIRKMYGLRAGTYVTLIISHCKVE